MARSTTRAIFDRAIGGLYGFDTLSEDSTTREYFDGLSDEDKFAFVIAVTREVTDAERDAEYAKSERDQFETVLTRVAGAVKENARRQDFCGEYEDFLDTLTAEGAYDGTADATAVFVAGADRRETYKVTLTLRARNNYVANDLVYALVRENKAIITHDYPEVVEPEDESEVTAPEYF